MDSLLFNDDPHRTKRRRSLNGVRLFGRVRDVGSPSSIEDVPTLFLHSSIRRCSDLPVAWPTIWSGIKGNGRS